MKKYLRMFIPKRIRNFYHYFRYLRSCKKEYQYDAKRYVRSTFQNDSENAIIANMTSSCHSIEKGLTMKNFRYGFAENRIEKLIEQCTKYIAKYQIDNVQVLYIIDTLQQYRTIHIGHEDKLNKALLKALDKFLQKNTIDYNHGIQNDESNISFFSHINASFDLFSNSRHSVRNFSNEKIQMDEIENAIKLSQNAPSACNRQPSRVLVVTKKELIKEVLKLQNGNRGFGEYFDKLIVLTGYMGGYGGEYERNAVFVDTGIFAMNLLYSLHFYKIGACILNWSTVKLKDVSMRNLLNIPDDEIISVLIGCGKLPENFKVCLSGKKGYKDIIRVL